MVGFQHIVVSCTSMSTTFGLILHGYFGILMCQKRCRFTGFCGSVVYDNINLKCSMHGHTSISQHDVKILHGRKSDVTVGDCNLKSEYVILKNGNSLCIPVYCVSANWEMVTVGQSWEDTNNIHTCNASGFLHTKPLMNIAVIFPVNDNDHYRICVFTSDTMTKILDTTQRMSLSWFGYDYSMNIYLWFDNRRKVVGTAKLTDRIILQRGFELNIEQDIDYIVSDLSMDSAFFRTYWGDILRSSFPPKKYRKICTSCGNVNVNLFQRRIYFTHDYKTGIFSADYNGENIKEFEILEVIKVFTTETFIYVCEGNRKLSRFNISNPLDKVDFNAGCYEVWWMYNNLIVYDVSPVRQLQTVISERETRLLIPFKDPKIRNVFIVPIKIT